METAIERIDGNHSNIGLARSKGFCSRSAALVAIVGAAVAASAAPAWAQTTPSASAARPAMGPAMDDESATRLLTQRGLTPAGRHWICPEDLRLRRQLDALDRHQKQFHIARKLLDQRIDENEKAGRSLAEIGQAIAQRQRLLASTKDSTVRRQTGDELARLRTAEGALRSRYLPPEQFAEDAALRVTLLEWINARNALAVAALGYEDALSRIEDRYDALRDDAEVQRALASLGRQNVLGGGRNLAASAPQIEDARRVALGAEAPLYRVSGQWRTSLLIGESTPAACSLVEQDPALILPESVARAAGIVLGQNLPKRRFTPADGRPPLEVQVVQLKRIRLGSHVITNVEAYILPPGAEDLGVMLSRRYLSGSRLELQPRMLRLIVRGNG
ncbi:MAG: hypothetical protein K8T91_06580 [Planctomycetes bacterium]|nr:hypothetical protein [Planctomycetota bacterium]